MLCSKCANAVTPVVALDIDGTLADYHQSLFNFAEDYFGQEFHSAWLAFDGTKELHEVMGLSKEAYRQMKLAYRQGGQKRMMRPYDGAVQLAREARSNGAEIWITTTRPWMRHDSTDPDTRHWLARHGVPYDYLLFDDDKYGILASIVEPSRVVFLLDDIDSNYDRAEALGLRPWLCKTRWNRGIQRPREISTLLEARGVLRTSLDRWKLEQKTDTIEEMGDGYADAAG